MDQLGESTAGEGRRNCVYCVGSGRGMEMYENMKIIAMEGGVWSIISGWRTPGNGRILYIDNQVTIINSTTPLNNII